MKQVSAEEETDLLRQMLRSYAIAEPRAALNLMVEMMQVAVDSDGVGENKLTT